jgi:hypothetical protein
VATSTRAPRSPALDQIAPPRFAEIGSIEHGRQHSDADSAQVADSSQGTVRSLSRSAQDCDSFPENLFQLGQQLVGGDDFEFVTRTQ